MSRGFERYDPYTRKYVEWATPHDWYGVGVDGWGVGPNNAGRTRFTREEKIKLNKIRQRGGKILPSEMGSDWNNEGPKVCSLFLQTRQTLMILGSDSDRNTTTSGGMPIDNVKMTTWACPSYTILTRSCKRISETGGICRTGCAGSFSHELVRCIVLGRFVLSLLGRLALCCCCARRLFIRCNHFQSSVT